MSPLVGRIVLGAGAVLMASMLPGVLRRARSAGDLGAAAGLTFAMGVLIVTPVAIVQITGGITEQLNSLGQTIQFLPSWYDRLDQLAKIAVIVLALGLLSRSLMSKTVPIQLGALLAICAVAIALVASALQGQSVAPLTSATLLACLAAAVVLPRGRGAAVGAGAVGVSLAIASSVLAVFRYDVAVRACARKCTPIHGLLLGVLSNPSLLGIVLAASIPFVFIGFRGRARYLLALYLGWMVIATGSRTASIAALAGLVVLLTVRPGLDGRRRIAFPTAALPWVLLIAAIGTGAYLGLHSWAPSALTDRGGLWALARQYIGRSPLVGYGPDTWPSLYLLGQIPLAAQVRSTHNELLDILFVSGSLGLVLFSSALAVTLATARRARLAMVATLGTLMTIGVAEGTWQVASYDFMSFSLVAFLLTGDSPVRKRRLRRPAGEDFVIREDPHERQWQRLGIRRVVLGVAAAHQLSPLVERQLFELVSGRKPESTRELHRLLAYVGEIERQVHVASSRALGLGAVDEPVVCGRLISASAPGTVAVAFTGQPVPPLRCFASDEDEPADAVVHAMTRELARSGHHDLIWLPGEGSQVAGIRTGEVLSNDELPHFTERLAELEQSWRERTARTESAVGARGETLAWFLSLILDCALYAESTKSGARPVALARGS